MGKYLIKRLIRGFFDTIVIVCIVMVIVYSLIDKETIVNDSDQTYKKSKNNSKICYKYTKWEDYGYIYYVNYTEFLADKFNNGEITEEEKNAAALGKNEGDPENYYIADGDSEACKKYVKEFVEFYQDQGYEITRLKRKTKMGAMLDTGGTQQLFASRNVPLIKRAWNFFTSIIHVDNIHYAGESYTEKRGITFSWTDPSKGEDVFSPCILGNGTEYKYLLYFDNKFPFVHQNLIKINLGTSTQVYKNNDVWQSLIKKQGTTIISNVNFPSGVVEEAADDLHSLRYQEGSYVETNVINYRRFVDDYTVTDSKFDGKSGMGYSFTIGIISTILAYIVGLPMGIWMARKKDKLVDKIGTIYIIFISAVPSLAYIYMFRALGGQIFGLPTTFFTDATSKAEFGNLIYILPIISLGLPQAAGLMKWIRRYMIDQQNSDYVKFARSEGLSEREIFSKHIAKNALIPIVHGIPAEILFALTGAVITERIYSCPGIGQALTKAINAQDNAVIVGLTLFYSILSIVSIILGDILMATVDPRISFSEKGGR